MTEQVHEWTERWWGMLPHAYQRIDNDLGNPLQRFMDGVGGVAGEFRQISDDLFDGTYTDPSRTPDHALDWVGMFLGLSEKVREGTPDQLRARIQATVTTGRVATGTRQGIAEAVRSRYPAASVMVRPHKTEAHVIVIHMPEENLPPGGLAAVEAWVNQADIVPAGHRAELQSAASTWDSFTAAAGDTWAEKEANIRTWNQNDNIDLD